VGYACDADDDGDGLPDELDGCPGVVDTGFDTDGDGVDDACDTCAFTSCVADGDGDGVPDDIDSCPVVWSSSQADRDGDGIGDACDPCNGGACDADGDGVADRYDLCPNSFDPAQIDTDLDGIGDACDVSVTCGALRQACCALDSCVTGTTCDAGSCALDLNGDGIPDDRARCDSPGGFLLQICTTPDPTFAAPSFGDRAQHVAE
jgi:hypothetical protein